MGKSIWISKKTLVVENLLEPGPFLEHKILDSDEQIVDCWRDGRLLDPPDFSPDVFFELFCILGNWISVHTTF